MSLRKTAVAIVLIFAMITGISAGIEVQAASKKTVRVSIAKETQKSFKVLFGRHSDIKD